MEKVHKYSLQELEEKMETLFIKLEYTANSLDTLGEKIRELYKDPMKSETLHKYYIREFSLAIENHNYQQDLEIVVQYILDDHPTHFNANRIKRSMKSFNRCVE
jgi:hypothetical protein